uniref:Olduvai domain-containing protein n=1 Tax=Pelusios castaneus TaxID=367368 RepID=A0A8C8SG05_9SAUR
VLPCLDGLHRPEAVWRSGRCPSRQLTRLGEGWKYDSLIQAQARELSHLRQKMREGRGLCHLLAQHLRDTVKSFEELLRGTDIDYYMGQSFREHLAQGSQLAEKLSSKLSSSAWLSHRLIWGKELGMGHKMIETLQAKLQERCETPSSSHTVSESPRSDSSTSFLSDSPEACSDGDTASEYSRLQERCSEQPPCLAGTAESFCFSWALASVQPKAGPMGQSPLHMPRVDQGAQRGPDVPPSCLSPSPPLAGTGADLLEGHLAEIRSLRQRLEESICTNDRLREQLEHRLAATAKGNGTGRAAFQSLRTSCSYTRCWDPALQGSPVPGWALLLWGRRS